MPVHRADRGPLVYVYLDGMVHMRNRSGEVLKASLLEPLSAPTKVGLASYSGRLPGPQRRQSWLAGVFETSQASRARRCPVDYLRCLPRATHPQENKAAAQQEADLLRLSIRALVENKTQQPTGTMTQGSQAPGQSRRRIYAGSFRPDEGACQALQWCPQPVGARVNT